MTSARGWPQRLKRRCEAVGWTVTRGRSGHYKVKTASGQTFVFPSTPGDTRAERNSLAEARRYGLEELEQRQQAAAERSRLKRIQVDRSKADRVLDALAAQINDEERGMARKEVAQTEGALGFVDGVAIAEIAPALFETPVTRGKKVALKDGEELLLADGRVLYRCLKPAAWLSDPTAKGICHKTFGTAQSLQSHITFHTRKTAPIAPGQKRKAARDSDYAEALEMARQAAADVALEAQIAVEQAPQTSSHGPGIVARAVRLTSRFEDLKGVLDELTANVGEALDQLHELVALLPDSVASDEVMDKAARYDELRKLIG